MAKLTDEQRQFLEQPFVGTATTLREDGSPHSTIVWVDLEDGVVSFNTATGGRCPSCEGQGVKVSEMAFLPDVVSPCEDCSGARFEPSTLEVRYAGLSIGDVLHLSAEDCHVGNARYRQQTRADGPVRNCPQIRRRDCLRRQTDLQDDSNGRADWHHLRSPGRARQTRARQL